VRSPQGCKIEYDYFDAGKLLFKVLEEEFLIYVVEDAEMPMDL
jgi:hypothetical protein